MTIVTDYYDIQCPLKRTDELLWVDRNLVSLRLIISTRLCPWYGFANTKSLLEVWRHPARICHPSKMNASRRAAFASFGVDLEWSEVGFKVSNAGSTDQRATSSALVDKRLGEER